MVEALIASALVLVPLFLAVPVIAKYLDIRSHVVQAARYAAWERSVWFGGDAAEPMGFSSGNTWDANAKDDGVISTEIGARILSESNTGSGFPDGSNSTSGFLYDPQNFWRDRGGNVLANYGDASGVFSGAAATVTSPGNYQAPGLFNDLFSPVMKVASVITNFTVDTHAQYTAQVGLSVKQVAFNPDTGLGGCPGCPIDFLASGTAQNFSETNVLVANTWSANGPGSLKDYGDDKTKGVLKMSVFNQVYGLTPTSLINPPSGAFRTALDVLQTIALIFFPELSTLDLGKIDVDQVPDDRLQ